MKLTKEESQALAFIGGLILISAIARFAGRPGPVTIEGNQVSIAELQAGSMALMTRANAAAAGASLGWVNLNAANEAEIAAIPKVGPAAAALIVAERDRLGGVLQLDDVRAIRGLKKAALEAIAENGSFGTWDDPGRMTPPPGLSALQQPARKKAGQGTARSTTGGSTGQRPTVVTGARRAGAPSATPPPVVRRAAPASGPAAQLIPVNEASAEELQRLPGVGPALAARIIAHREQHGPFRTLQDLDAVSGIGPALLKRIGPMVRF